MPIPGTAWADASPTPSVSPDIEPAVTPAPSPSPLLKHSKHPKAAAAKKSAKAAAQTQFMPQLLREVEEKYSKSPTLMAEFSQTDELVAMNRKKTSSGHIEIKRPDKVRWQTEKPDQNLLVSDGHQFWFYTPPFDKDEHGQVIERKSGQVQSRMAQALLSGRFSMANGAKITTESAFRFAISPKPGMAGDVTRAVIEIDPNERLIKKVTLSHKGGNKTEITLSHIQLGKQLDDSEFVFQAPPNTDQVKE